MLAVSVEKKEKILAVLEVAIEVATPFQLGRLCGIGEQIARGHEEENMSVKQNSKKEATEIK